MPWIEIQAAMPEPSRGVLNVNRMIEQEMQNKSIPGIAIALYYEEKGYLLNFGVANKKTKRLITQDSIFELASVTKIFTSTALAVEVLLGKMKLDDPVTKFLPEIRRPRDLQSVTLAQLATHTSSLPRVPPPHGKQKYNHQKLMIFLQNWEAGYPIGSRYVYSNLGFGVIGNALAYVENENYGSVIKKLITEPLGMSSTFIHVPADLMDNYAQGYSPTGKPVRHYELNAWPAGGALRSTSRDMLKFLKANLDLEGPELLRNAMQLAQQGIFKVNENLTLSLGWQRFKKENLLIIDKNGGVPGFSSYIGMIPAKKMGIVILANKSKVQATGLGRKILLSLSENNKDVRSAKLHN